MHVCPLDCQPRVNTVKKPTSPFFISSKKPSQHFNIKKSVSDTSKFLKHVLFLLVLVLSRSQHHQSCLKIILLYSLRKEVTLNRQARECVNEDDQKKKKILKISFDFVVFFVVNLDHKKSKMNEVSCSLRKKQARFISIFTQ